MMINDPYKKKDEQLFAEVQKLKDGDFSNSNAVYELSEKYIYKIINDIVKNHHMTEDLMQEAYIQIYNKIGTLQEVKAFYVWAGRIATNLTLRYIQKNSKEVLATADDEGDTDFIFDTASEDNEKFIPESVLVDREKQRLIAEIIDKLSTEQKICIQYFYYEEMSVNQIAEAMGCSTGTIKSRLNYARKSIKEAVVELDEKHGTRLYSLASAPLFLIIFRAAVEGLLPAAVAGAASAVAVGGASVVSGASSAGSAGGASTVAGMVPDSAISASETYVAGKTASATEESASAGRIEEVKNLVLEKLKKMGGDISTDVKKASEAAKETVKEHGTKIKNAFQNGKKEGAKQILESLGNCTVNTLKGIGACTVSTKVVLAIIVVVILIPKNTGHSSVPMEAPIPPMEDPIAVEEVWGQEEEIVEEVVEEATVSVEDVKVSDVKKDEYIEVGMHIRMYLLPDGRVFYHQWEPPVTDDEVIADMSWGGVAETPNAEITNRDLEEFVYESGKDVLSEESFETVIDFGMRYFDESTPSGQTYSVWLEEENEEVNITLEGEEYVYTIEKISAETISFVDYNYMHTYLMNGEVLYVDGGYSFVFALSGKARLVSDNELEELGETESISGTSSAMTSPGVTDIADPSELEGIIMPDIELPTVEVSREIEQMQTILYVEYSRTNMTDEVFYSLMEQVPCTVYLQDGSSHSVTLAEFIFKDWSSYADLDKLDYDSNKARELSDGYRTTDSLIEN